MVKEIVKGIVVGLLLPLILVGIVFIVFYSFDKTLKMDIVVSVLLFAIGINALIIRRLFKKNKDYLGRGIMIASFLYFFYILYQYVFLS